MTIRPPGWIQALTYSAENDRLANFPMFSQVGSSTSAQFIDSHGWDGGVGLTYANVGLKVVQHAAGANMSVDVSPGVSLIPGQTATTQGMYTCTSDAIVNVAIATAPITNTRIDLVYMAVADAGYTGVANAATVAVVTGTPGVSPAVPALPANAIPLARIAVGTSVTSILTANITDVRVAVGASGGLAQAPSGFMPLYAPAGQILCQPDTGKLKTFSTGGAWEDLYQPGAWVSYSPILTNFTLGNGTQLCTYQKVGRTVTVRYHFRFGSTSTFSAGWTVSIPFTSVATLSGAQVPCVGSWSAIAGNSPTPNFIGSVFLAAGSAPATVQFLSNASGNPVGSTVPATWIASTTNELSAIVTYEATT